VNYLEDDKDLYIQKRDDSELIYKIIVVGDPAIGKTSLIRKYVKISFEFSYIPTVGVAISKQPIELDIYGKKVKINLMLWDLAGQPQFSLLHKVYYNGAQGILLGFDLTRTHTYSNMKNWAAEFKKCGLLDTPMIMFGNKSDLTEERKVSHVHIDHMKDQLDIADYVETSALTGDKVNDLFELIAKLVHDKLS
jgi:small GTP-binding protein